MLSAAATLKPPVPPPPPWLWAKTPCAECPWVATFAALSTTTCLPHPGARQLLRPVLRGENVNRRFWDSMVNWGR